MTKSNLFRHESAVSRETRIAQMRQRGCTLWLTGLSGAGKSTIAQNLEQRLVHDGYAAYVLDGDNLRMGLNSDLGFSAEDRAENIRRIGEVALLFADANIITITAFISPFRADRDRIRTLHKEGNFIEVFIDCPLKICEERDTKGLYARARRGEVAEFTGIASPYEPPLPEAVEISIKTNEIDALESAAVILEYLKRNNYVLPR